MSIATVKRLEAAEGELGGRLDTTDKLRSALEAAGVEFTNGGRPGVRLVSGLVVHGRPAPLTFNVGDRVRFKAGFHPPWLKDPRAIGTVLEPPYTLETGGFLYVEFENQTLEIDPGQIKHVTDAAQ